jgi:hypothetical protein
MKHHVLLGLILGLLATAKLGGQVLFEVTFNPELGELNVRSTGNTPISLSGKFVANGGGINDTLNTFSDGITLTNLFKTGPDFSGTMISGTSSLSATVNGSPVLFGFGDIPFEIAPGGAEVPGIVNNGRHLAIYSGTEDSQLFNAGTLLFAQNGTITFQVGVNYVPPVFEIGNNYVGPTNVYAGSHYGSTYSADSILGTYSFSVVPEPSTYAAIAGGLGLAAAVLHRRRQRARATAA